MIPPGLQLGPLHGITDTTEVERTNETKRAIREAFIALWGRMPYDKMSVKGLCAQVPVARTTFYEHYDNLGALKAEIEDGLIDGLLELAVGSFDEIDLAVFSPMYSTT